VYRTPSVLLLMVRGERVRPGTASKGFKSDKAGPRHRSEAVDHISISIFGDTFAMKAAVSFRAFSGSRSIARWL